MAREIDAREAEQAARKSKAGRYTKALSSMVGSETWYHGACPSRLVAIESEACQ